jgi:Phosphotransferase enzyme family
VVLVLAWPGAVLCEATGTADAGLDSRRAGHFRATERWPWLRPAGAPADLVAKLFDETWPQLAARGDLTELVRATGERLKGQVTEAVRAVASAGTVTLVHGDASTLNMRTGPDDDVVLLDWEDTSAAPGVLDLVWLLVSSVEPARRGDRLKVRCQAGSPGCRRMRTTERISSTDPNAISA